MKNLTILNLLYLFGIIQALFFAFLFLLKKKRLVVDIIAGFWLILFSLDFSIVLVLDFNSPKNILLSNFELLFTLLNGPFLFFYIKKLLFEQNSFKPKEFVHFSPFVLGLFAVILFNKSDLTTIIPYTGILSGLIYIIYSISLLLKFKSYPNLASETIKNIKWLLNLCLGLFVVWILPLIIVNFLRTTEQDLQPDMFYILVPVFIFYLSFKGINQQLIYTLPAQKDIVRMISNINKSNKSSVLYMNSTLGNEQMKKIYALLEQSMKEAKLFLNPDLNLNLLSKELDIPQHHITQTLNMYSNQNFNDFINYYRTEEFKQRIRTIKNLNYTLFGIAFECGFNSKPSFNRIFKKFTGQTPTEFIEGLNS